MINLLSSGRRFSGHHWEALSEKLVDASSFSVSGLEPGVTYKFRAFAFSQNSFSTSSQVEMYKVPGEIWTAYIGVNILCQVRFGLRTILSRG